MSKAGEFLKTVSEDTKKDRMYVQIERHGNNLNKIFKTGMDPVALCKKLFSLETKMRRATVADNNGDIEWSEYDKIEKEILAKVDKILGYKVKKIPVFVNSDARGYALKIKDDWLRKNDITLYTDMGGYGILAPDFREG
jgi:hypothetical protein